MKTTDKKNKKAQPELLRALDQPMISKIKEEKDARKANLMKNKKNG